MAEESNDAVAIEHETITRGANLIVTVVPLALLGFSMPLSPTCLQRH